MKPAGFALRTDPKSKFGEPRKETHQKPQKPKTTHAILSRLQDRGAWVWSQCWRGAKRKKRWLVSQKLVMGGSFQSPCNGFERWYQHRVMELVGNESYDKGEGFLAELFKPQTNVWMSKHKETTCQLSPVSGWSATCGVWVLSSRTTWLWFWTDSNEGSWDVVVFSTEYEAPMATCST